MIGNNLFSCLLADIIAVVGCRYFLYLGLMALTGLLEGITLASVVPLLAAIGVGAVGGDAGGKLGAVAVVVLDFFGLQPTVISIGMVVLSALMVSTLLFLAQAYVGASLQTIYVYRWQRRLVEAIFGAQWGYFQKCRHGELINAVITETQRLGGAFYQAGLLLTGIVHGLIFLIVAAMLSGPTTMFVMAGGAVLFLITRPLIQRAYRIGTGISHENAEFQSLIGELISGAKLVKATATETEAVHLLSNTAFRLRQHFFANAFDIQIVKGIFDFGAAAMVAGILVASQTVLRSDPSVTLVILAIFVRLMPKLTGVQQSLQSLTISLSAVELLRTMVTQAENDAESVSAEPLPEGFYHGPLMVSLRDITVHYDAVMALSGVTIDIPAGSCVALVGGSGAGKSSLVDAVLGLVPLCSGEISINGEALQRLPLASMRRRIGYMGQDTVLYNASIRDNILWGNSGLGDKEIDEAVCLAGADRFINGMKKGLDTSVGDRGALLSGGERQRLGLARAALGKPGLLILDEATSALDAETERTVTDAVAALKGKTTVIMIAHRLSSVRIADTICVMEGGRIIEQGSWGELMQRKGRFHQLWQLQNTDERASNAKV